MPLLSPPISPTPSGVFSALTLRRMGPASSFASAQIIFDAAQVLVGTHRIQRIPHNEKRGRRHSSSVIVTLAAATSVITEIDPDDVDEQFYRGSGPGGQHRNTSETDVRLVHRPTGITVTASGRSQWHNRTQAWENLKLRLTEREIELAQQRSNDQRRSQAAGPRQYTWCAWRDQVSGPHGTVSMKQALRGRLQGLVQ